MLFELSDIPEHTSEQLAGYTEIDELLERPQRSAERLPQYSDLISKASLP